MRPIEIKAELPQEAVNKILENTKEDMDRMLSLGYAFDLSDGKDRTVTYISFPNGTDPKDVAPVVHAKWIIEKRGNFVYVRCGSCGGYAYKCFTDDFAEQYLSNYCLNCGAKMDRGDK